MNPIDPLADIKRDLPPYYKGSSSAGKFDNVVNKGMKTTRLLTSILSLLSVFGLFARRAKKDRNPENSNPTPPQA
ncbi:MAG: hypothetical protein HYT43_02620 [Candidatus Taylorbacteria bacterium]|nr:hypothetical protein [Candidatus Taylorbacteria bacterium]